jgi:hypothetical protein
MTFPEGPDCTAATLPGRTERELAEFRAAARVLREHFGDLPAQEIMDCFDGLGPDETEAIHQLSMLVAEGKPPEHGELAKYHSGCRCEPSPAIVRAIADAEARGVTPEQIADAIAGLTTEAKAEIRTDGGGFLGAIQAALAAHAAAAEDDAGAADLLGHTRRIGRLANCREIPGFVRLTEADGVTRLINPHKAVFEVEIVTEEEAAARARPPRPAWDARGGRVYDFDDPWHNDEDDEVDGSGGEGGGD